MAGKRARPSTTAQRGKNQHGIPIETHIGLGLSIAFLNYWISIAYTQTDLKEQDRLLIALRKALDVFKNTMDNDVCRQLPEATGNGYRLAPKLYYSAPELSIPEIKALQEFESRVKALDLDHYKRKFELTVRILNRELAPVEQTDFADQYSAVRLGFITAQKLFQDFAQHLTKVAAAFAPVANGLEPVSPIDVSKPIRADSGEEE